MYGIFSLIMFLSSDVHLFHVLLSSDGFHVDCSDGAGCSLKYLLTWYVKVSQFSGFILL